MPEVASEPANAPTAEQGGRRVGWVELFFDLVFVVAVTATSRLVASDTSPGGLLRSLITFVPVYWLWVGTAIRTNLNDDDRPARRIWLFAIALSAVFMATALPAAYDDGAVVFAIAYWFGRLVLGTPAVIEARGPRTPYAVSIAVTGPLLLVGALVGGSAQEAVWALAAVVDLATPWAFHRALARVHYDAGHLVERYGLFVMIALGESMVAVAPSSPYSWTFAVDAAITAAFVLACATWWLYFDYAFGRFESSLRASGEQISVVRNVLSYGHLGFICAIVVMAVGVKQAIAEPNGMLTWPHAALLYGGVALFCATFGFTRWVVWRHLSRRIVVAVLLISLAPLAAQMPAVAALWLLAAVLVGLNVVEWFRIKRPDA